MPLLATAIGQFADGIHQFEEPVPRIPSKWLMSLSNVLFAENCRVENALSLRKVLGITSPKEKTIKIVSGKFRPFFQFSPPLKKKQKLITYQIIWLGF